MTYDKKYDKYYIGKRSCPCNINDDWYFGSGNIIRRIIKKYSKEEVNKRLAKTILHVSKTYEENIEMESYYIKRYNADTSDKFYNIAQGGYGGNLISGMSPEEKLIVYKKIGDKSRGHVTPDYVKKKISDGGKGKKRSSETRNNIREAKIGEKNPFYSKKHSEEELRLISQHLTGKNNPRAVMCKVIDNSNSKIFTGIRKDVETWAKENGICSGSTIKKLLYSEEEFNPMKRYKTCPNAFLYKGMKVLYA